MSDEPPWKDDKITFNRDEKFDFQLNLGQERERYLAGIFVGATFERARIELKSEGWLWERTGNMCVEYMRDGKPSGISTTKAKYWVEELRRDGKPLCYLMFPIERIKELARAAIRRGRRRSGAGDDGRSTVALIRLKDLR